jgi:hypothetical protein
MHVNSLTFPISFQPYNGGEKRKPLKNKRDMLRRPLHEPRALLSITFTQNPYEQRLGLCSNVLTCRSRMVK